MLEKLTYEVKAVENGNGVVFNRPPKRTVLDFLKSKGFRWDWTIKAWVHKTMSVDKINEIMQKKVVRTYGTQFYGTEAVVVNTQMYADTEAEKTKTTTKSSKKTGAKSTKAKADKPLCTEKQRVQAVLSELKKGSRYETQSVFVSKDTQCWSVGTGEMCVLLKDNLLTDTNIPYNNDSKLIDRLEPVADKIIKNVKGANHRLENFYEFVDVSTVYQKHEGVVNVCCIKCNGTEMYFNPEFVKKALKVGFTNCKTITISMERNILVITSSDTKNKALICGLVKIDERIKDICPTYEV